MKVQIFQTYEVLFRRTADERLLIVQPKQDPVKYLPSVVLQLISNGYKTSLTFAR